MIIMKENLYDKLKINRKISNQNKEGKLHYICKNIEKEINETNKNGKTYLNYYVDEYDKDYTSKIIEYFVNKKIYCKVKSTNDDEDNLYYSMEFYWDKPIEEYIKTEKIHEKIYICLACVYIILFSFILYCILRG